MAIDRHASMKPTNRSSEKRKQLLVGVLAIALLMVLRAQYQSTEDEASDSVLPPAVAVGVPVVADATVDASSMQSMPMLKRDFGIQELPRRTLDEILQEAPLLAVPVPPVPKQVHAEPERIVVQAVYGSGQKSAAIVGERIIHAGEVLPDGRRLVGAGPNGVRMTGGLLMKGRDALSAPAPSGLE